MIRFMKIFAVIYCVTGLAIYLLQEYIILRPVKLSRDYHFRFGLPFNELNIPYDSKTNINIVQFPTTNKNTRGVLLYFHGNRTNISRYEKFVPYYTKSGYEVWMIDYPGYGKSTGTFSENLVYEWSLIMYRLARTKFSPDRIVIYGKSLGTGIAAQLASVRNCRFLVLETPYYSMPAVIGYYAPVFPVDRMIRLQFPTYKYLPKVTDPVIIFHGTNDRTIAYRNSIKLKPFLKPNDKLYTLKGGKHNNLYTFPEVPRVIDSLLNLP